MNMPREGVEIPVSRDGLPSIASTCCRADGDSLVVRVECSKGTYVRTLDLRGHSWVRSPSHRLAADADRAVRSEWQHPLADFEALPAEDREGRLAPVDALLGHLPRVAAFDAVQARSFTHGQSAAGCSGGWCDVRAYDGNVSSGGRFPKAGCWCRRA